MSFTQIRLLLTEPLGPSPIHIVVVVVDDIMTMTGGHLPRALTEGIEARPDPFGGFSIGHPNTGKEVEGELEATAGDVARQMELPDGQPHLE